MRKSKLFISFFIASIFLFFNANYSRADIQEDIFHIPGTVEGSGSHFEIKDSTYLNISLDSSEEISVKIESAPKMVVLDIKASDNAVSSEFMLAGFSSNTIYYKYQDDYHDYIMLTADENGKVFFEQDISRDHRVFIQPIKSTKFIRDDATGGDCPSIGNWNWPSRTCILEQDVDETIQIDGDNITLDGNNHAVTGKGTGSGVYAMRRKGTIVKNIVIVSFYYGINFSYSEGGRIEAATISNNNQGIELAYSSGNEILNNVVKENKIYGIELYYSGGNKCVGNVAGPNNMYGISEEYRGNNIYENNAASNNGNTGIRLSQGGNGILRGNVTNSNLYRGIQLDRAAPFVMKHNSLSENGDSNLDIFNSISLLNDIDTSNTEGGNPIRYLKNIENETFDGVTDMGSFYCFNCKNITLKNLFLPAGVKIFFQNVLDSSIENITSSNQSTKVYVLSSSRNTIANSDLKDIYVTGSYNKIYGNNFWSPYSSFSSSKTNLFNLDLPIGGNYWKKNETYCKDINEDGFCDLLYVISANGYDWLPRAKPVSFNNPHPPACCSSVIFLPGHQASRLYTGDADGEDQLWEPTNHNEDVRQLYLNTNGESIDPGIYTREVMDEIYGGVGNVYKSFMDSMDQVVAEGIINEWKPIPYDWRLPLDKIVDDGVNLESGGHTDIVKELKRMAASSKTGKVVLIGHSNGGLLAKGLIEKLKATGEEKLVDKLIMVGTPQLGTPKALAALLHGDGTNLLYGLILDKETGRGFAENMASAYNLLPSKKYFDVVQSPVIEFDEDVNEIYDFRSLYGENIASWDKFRKFLLGDDGVRVEPEAGDLDSPNVLRDKLLARAESVHRDIDDWQAPEGMEVIQIAGWGLDTIRGIKYDDCDIPFCPDRLSNLDRSMIVSEDGDGTVVTPSAVSMGNSAEKYYLDFSGYNDRQETNSQHADIFEVSPIQNFIKSIIRDNKALPEFISAEKPETTNENKRLRFTLHSPVSINLYDKNNNHTGLIENPNFPGLKLYEERIPNSYYMEFGEKKYAGSESDTDIVLTGEDLGVFTLDIDEVAGGVVTKTTIFPNIPVMKNMKATVSVSEIGVGDLKIDVNNDGQIDAIFHPGEEITKADLLEMLSKIVASLDVDEVIKERLVNKIDNAKKQIEKGHGVSANAMLENVKQQIENFSREQATEKFRLSSEDAGKIIEIINKIQVI